MRTIELQASLNAFRFAREPSLRRIPATGVFDECTAKALRAFQHEHNDFMGQHVLTESGCPDADTVEAIAWWNTILMQKVIT